MTAAAANPPFVSRRGASLTLGPAVLVVAIIVSGFSAAYLVVPQFWILTPIVASGIVLAAALRRRAIAELETVLFPPALRRTVTAAMEELPQGEARDLLSAVVRQGHAIFASQDQRFTDAAANALRRDVADLVDACCSTALDLARLDAFLAPAVRSLQPSAGSRADLDSRGKAARVLFARRLADADLALRSLYTAGVERGTPASDRVAELVTEIQSDAEARRSASDELRRLLGTTA